MSKKNIRANRFPHVVPFDTFHVCAEVSQLNDCLVHEFLFDEIHKLYVDIIAMMKEHTSIIMSCFFMSVRDSFFRLSSSICILDSKVV